MTDRRSDLLESAPIALSWLVIALMGAWIGHTLEYLRVYGPAGVSRELAGSAHLYMGPLGALLFASATVAVLRWRHHTRALDRRLGQGRGALRSGRRPTDDGPAVKQAGHANGLPHEWLALFAGQVVIYFVQENIESLRATGRTPGIGVLMGAHWAAPLIHAGVALSLAGALFVLRRRRALLVRQLWVVEALIGRLWPRRAGRPATPSASANSVTPHQRWGRQLWQRPPPRGATSARHALA